MSEKIDGEKGNGAERKAVPLRGSGSASLPPPGASLAPPPSSAPHDYLRRLAPEAYRGRACVHWTLTVARRRTGWLDARAHALWREVWLHTLTRYRLALPIYCLMPDIIEKRRLTELNVNPAFSMADFKAVPKEWRDRLPECGLFDAARRIG